LAHAKNRIKPTKARRGKTSGKLKHKKLSLSMKARKLLHRRCAHASEAKMRMTSKVPGIEGFPYGGPHGKDCWTCVQMIASKAPFGVDNYEPSTTPGERVHSDIKVVPAASIGGHIYAICFVDCFSKHGTIYALKTLKGGEAVDCFRDYVERCEA
jgi:hypothetical protein